MGIQMTKPMYYYPHYVYVSIRYIIEYYIPLSNTDDINEVYDNIYVGNISTAYNKDKLKELGITHVVSAISGMHEIYPDDFKYMVVDVLDIKKQNLLPVFDKTTEFIENALKDNGKVYVHCMCGVSRSVSIVCAYLAKTHNIEPLAALKLIKHKRVVANPNPSFLQQLQNYYLKINNDETSDVKEIISKLPELEN